MVPPLRHQLLIERFPFFFTWNISILLFCQLIYWIWIITPSSPVWAVPAVAMVIVADTVIAVIIAVILLVYKPNSKRLHILISMLDRLALRSLIVLILIVSTCPSFISSLSLILMIRYLRTVWIRLGTRTGWVAYSLAWIIDDVAFSYSDTAVKLSESVSWYVSFC